MAVRSVVNLSALATGLRLDSEYYQPLYLAAAKKLVEAQARSIGSFAFVTDGIHASPDEVETGGVRYLSAKCVKENTFALGDALQISQSQHDANPRTSLQENDVLITTVGTIGNVAVVQRDILPANADRHLGIVRINPDADVDPYYLSTFLNCEYGRFQSLREATGNVQLNLFIEKIKELRVPILACADEVGQQTRAAYEKQRESRESIAAAEVKLMEALGLDHLDLTAQKCYSRNFRELQAGKRFGAEYYMPCKKRVLDALRRLPHKTIAYYATGIRETWDPGRARAGERVRNFDITDALVPFLDDLEPQLAGDIGSTKKRFQAGDVVISRLRSYLKEIAIVRTSNTLPSVGSSEFVVLRPNGGGLAAETLMVFLRCSLVQTILKWSQDGSNHPRFAEDDLLEIPVPDALLRVQKNIEPLVNKAIEARRESAKLLNQTRKIVEEMVARAAAGRRK